MRHPFPPFAWKTLRRALHRRRAREPSLSAVRSMLRFQRTLARWKTPERAPDATPFVSLYAGGQLRGCYGSDEGPPGERLARAFLRAMDDGRFGGVRSGERDRRRRAGLVRASGEAREPGDGRGRAGARRARSRPSSAEKGPSVVLLPDVARDERVGAAELVRRLARKAGLGDDGLREQALYLVETERRRRPRRANALRGAAWTRLAAGSRRSSQPDGRVTFAVDPRARARRRRWARCTTARASVVAHALAGRRDRTAATADRVRRRLLAEARAALAGSPRRGMARGSGAGRGDPRRSWSAPASRCGRSSPPSWPRTTSGALAVALGAGGRGPRRATRRRGSGARAVADLDVHPWAPWTLARGRTRAATCACVRVPRGPSPTACATRSPAPRRRYDHGDPRGRAHGARGRGARRAPGAVGRARPRSAPAPSSRARSSSATASTGRSIRARHGARSPCRPWPTGSAATSRRTPCSRSPRPRALLRHRVQRDRLLRRSLAAHHHGHIVLRALEDVHARLAHVHAGADGEARHVRLVVGDDLVLRVVRVEAQRPDIFALGVGVLAAKLGFAFG